MGTPRVRPILSDSASPAQAHTAGSGDRNVAIGIVRNSAVLAIAFVALRSPRRGRVARRAPSIAIVGRRLLGRLLLGDTRRALSCAATPPFVATHKPGRERGPRA